MKKQIMCRIVMIMLGSFIVPCDNKPATSRTTHKHDSTDAVVENLVDQTFRSWTNRLLNIENTALWKPERLVVHCGTNLQSGIPCKYGYAVHGDHRNIHPCQPFIKRGITRHVVKSGDNPGNNSTVAGMLRGHKLMLQRIGGYSIADFELDTEEVDVGMKKTLRVFRPKDPDAIYDMQDRLQRPYKDAFWVFLWPSSIALAEYMMKYPDLVKGKTVCDLGAGLGLGGLTAAVAGAKTVKLYDRELLPLQCALLSATENGLSVADASEDCVKPVEGEDAGMCDIAAEIFDWYKVPADQVRFDVVLASDILYNKGALEPLSQVIPKLAKAGATVLLAYPDRAPQNVAVFKKLIAGWAEFMIERIVYVNLRGSTRKVFLLEFNVKQGAVEEAARKGPFWSNWLQGLRGK